MGESKLKWQDALGIVGVLLAVGGMSDMPIALRLFCFLGSALCLSVSFSSHTEWPIKMRWLLSLCVMVLMGYVSFQAYTKWSIDSAESKSKAASNKELLDVYKRSDDRQKYLEKFPLGYTIFRINAVSQAVTPLQAEAGMDGYSFNFSDVRVLENSPTHITLRLPSVEKDGATLMRNMDVSDDKEDFKHYGSGYGFGSGPTTLTGIAQILDYSGNDVTWLFGVRRSPNPAYVPKPKQQ